MSKAGKGVRVPLSPARRLAIEFLRHARRAPSVPVARTMSLGETAAARREANPAPSWTALFLRAFGLVAREHSGLRRAFIPYPSPHLYEHPHSLGVLMVERALLGERAVLGAKVRGPESMSLELLQDHVRHFKEDPVETIGPFRQALRLGRLPAPLRRLVFWQTLYLSGSTRARRFGTFTLSSYGSLGAEQVHPLSPLLPLLTFGPIDAAGAVAVKIVYDHRVLDGASVARSLADLEGVLRTEIVRELQQLRRAAGVRQRAAGAEPGEVTAPAPRRAVEATVPARPAGARARQG